MENYEREEEGVSLLSILKVIFGRKILLLIVSLSVAIVLFLVLNFGLNSMVQTYEASFSFSDPNMIQGKYIDGSGFNYNSLITRSNLQSIKDSNEDYKSIDLDQIFENNGISISVEETYSLDELTLRSQVYTIKTNKKYYSSDKQARNFVEDIIETATRNNETKVQNLFYDSNLEAYEKATTLDQKLYYLKSQYNYITNRYLLLKDTYSDFVISSTNKSLTSYANDFKSAFYLTENSVEALNSSLVNNVYALDYTENEELYRNLYNTYKNLYDTNERLIDETSDTLAQIIDKIKINATEFVTKDSFDLSKLEQTIITATLENTDYKTKINYYANVLGLLDTTDENYHARASQEESEAFLAKLDSTKELLDKYTDIYKDVEVEVLTANNNVYYSYNNVIIVSGGLKLIYALVIAVVLGFVTGCIVNFIIDFKKLLPAEANTDSNKKEEKEEASEEETKE